MPITGIMLAVLVSFYLKPVFLKPVRFFLFPLEQTKLINPSLWLHICYMSLCPWFGEKRTRTFPFWQRLHGPTILLPFYNGPIRPFLFAVYSFFICSLSLKKEGHHPLAVIADLRFVEGNYHINQNGPWECDMQNRSEIKIFAITQMEWCNYNLDMHFWDFPLCWWKATNCCSETHTSKAKRG